MQQGQAISLHAQPLDLPLLVEAASLGEVIDSKGDEFSIRLHLPGPSDDGPRPEILGSIDASTCLPEERWGTSIGDRATINGVRPARLDLIG